MRSKHLVLIGILSLAGFLFTSLPLFSQSSNWYEGKPVRSVDFVGLNTIKKSELDGIVSSFKGKIFTDELVLDLYNRMFALDYFDDVIVKVDQPGDNYQTCKLIVEVTERPSIAKIVFTGNRQIHTSELKDKIAIKEKDVFIQSKLLIDERTLRNHYIDKGYSQAVVTSTSEKTDAGVVITFNINEGKQIVVKEIRFEGLTLVNAKTLKRKLTLKETNIFNAGSFKESSIEADKKIIATYFQDRGYVDARVLNVTQTSEYNSEKNRDELTIIFKIQEGSEYNFGGLAFEGNKVFTTEKLSSLVKLGVGKKYNETRFQESLAAVQNLYYENGYTSNSFTPEVLKDTDAKTIAYVLHIHENPRSHIEDIIIKGNTKTKEYVIRREIPIESGDIFSYSKLTTAVRNLYNLQYFSTVMPQIPQGSEQNLVDLVFEVEEQSTTSLDLGFTFSGVTDPDEFPVAFYTKIQDSNLFGEGRSVSASITLSTTEQSVSLGYGQNWLWGLPVSFNLSLGYTHANQYALRNKILPDGTIDNSYYYMQYEEHSFNLGASLGRRWTPDFAILTLTGGLSGSLINNIYNQNAYVPYDASISQYNNNWEPKNSIWTAFSMDDRNINYDPSNGWFFSQRLAWFGLLPQGLIDDSFGETEFYLRTDTKLEYYYTLINKPVSENWSFKLIAMAYSGLSFQFPFFNSTIKQSNKLYIDGMFNGRGWTIYNTTAGRGQAMWSNILELRMPVVPGVISVDLIGDAVCIKNTFDGLFTDFANDESWYFSWGPSLRFCIQQFPLRFLFMNTFKIEDGAVVWTDQRGQTTDWISSWHFVLSFNLTNR